MISNVEGAKKTKKKKKNIKKKGEQIFLKKSFFFLGVFLSSLPHFFSSKSILALKLITKPFKALITSSETLTFPRNLETSLANISTKSSFVFSALPNKLESISLGIEVSLIRPLASDALPRLVRIIFLAKSPKPSILVSFWLLI